MSRGTSMGVAYETRAPLRWSFDPHLPTGTDSSALSQEVEETLQAVTGLEEMRAPVSDESSPTGQGLAHLEFKLNLVLELLSELVSQSQERPPCHQVKIGARQVSWLADVDTVPDVGARGTVDLFIHPLYVRPLSLPGRISTVDSAGDHFQVTLELSDLEPMALEALERWIFLHHRRAVAQARPGKM